MEGGAPATPPVSRGPRPKHLGLGQTLKFVDGEGAIAAREARALPGIRPDSPESFRGWAHQDSNLGPRDYESPALTAEL